MARKPETVFKDRIRPKLEALPNTWWVKTQQKSIRGTPDFLGCVNGTFVALELKAGEHDHVDALQLYNLRLIKESGGVSFLCYPENFEEIYGLLELLAQRPPRKTLRKVTQ